jgi:DNA-binding beta-propeller fold protein YncE
VPVIDTATDQVTAIDVVSVPVGVAVSPDGTRAYVTNYSGSVSVIDTGTCHRHHP